MIYRTAFDVIGRYQFPLDMLRYDMCSPASGSDVTTLARASQDDYAARKAYLAGEPEGWFRIRLVTDKRGGPTLGRWASFNWSVDPASISEERL